MFCNGWILGHERLPAAPHYPVNSGPMYSGEPELWSIRGEDNGETQRMGRAGKEADVCALRTAKNKYKLRDYAVAGFLSSPPVSHGVPTYLPTDSTSGCNDIRYRLHLWYESVICVTRECEYAWRTHHQEPRGRGFLLRLVGPASEQTTPSQMPATAVPLLSPPAERPARAAGSASAPHEERSKSRSMSG